MYELASDADQLAALVSIRVQMYNAVHRSERQISDRLDRGRDSISARSGAWTRQGPVSPDRHRDSTNASRSARASDWTRPFLWRTSGADWWRQTVADFARLGEHCETCRLFYKTLAYNVEHQALRFAHDDDDEWEQFVNRCCEHVLRLHKAEETCAHQSAAITDLAVYLAALGSGNPERLIDVALSEGLAAIRASPDLAPTLAYVLVFTLGAPRSLPALSELADAKRLLSTAILESWGVAWEPTHEFVCLRAALDRHLGPGGTDLAALRSDLDACDGWAARTSGPPPCAETTPPCCVEAQHVSEMLAVVGDLAVYCRADSVASHVFGVLQAGDAHALRLIDCALPGTMRR
jgi:hypothetical protein